jgi:hypothetical protein
MAKPDVVNASVRAKSHNPFKPLLTRQGGVIACKRTQAEIEKVARRKAAVAAERAMERDAGRLRFDDQPPLPLLPHPDETVPRCPPTSGGTSPPNVMATANQINDVPSLPLHHAPTVVSAAPIQTDIQREASPRRPADRRQTPSAMMLTIWNTRAADVARDIADALGAAADGDPQAAADWVDAELASILYAGGIRAHLSIAHRMWGDKRRAGVKIDRPLAWISRTAATIAARYAAEQKAEAAGRAAPKLPMSEDERRAMIKATVAEARALNARHDASVKAGRWDVLGYGSAGSEVRP